MNARLQPSCLQLLFCTVATFLAAGEATAQTILIQAAATPVPVPPWVVPLLTILLAATGYAILHRRLPQSLARLRGLPLLAIVAAAAFTATMSGDWVSRAYATVCSNCSFDLNRVPDVIGPVAWDTDVTVTNRSQRFAMGPVDVACPSYAACALVTPLTAPATPQCAPGLILANDATCVLRVETHAGSALRSGAANKYVLAGAVDGILSAVGVAPGPALGQFAVELDGSNFVLRSIGNGKYFLVHGDSFVYADAAAPGVATAWVFFVVDSNAAESQVFIFEDGPVNANINVLQYDSVSKNLHVVTLPGADAFNDPNSVFYFSPPPN